MGPLHFADASWCIWEIFCSLTSAARVPAAELRAALLASPTALRSVMDKLEVRGPRRLRLTTATRFWWDEARLGRGEHRDAGAAAAVGARHCAQGLCEGDPAVMVGGDAQKERAQLFVNVGWALEENADYKGAGRALQCACGLPGDRGSRRCGGYRQHAKQHWERARGLE